MAAKFTRIGGRPVFISDDEGCATDVGYPMCSGRVVAWIVGRVAGPARRANPDLRRGLVIVPKCRKHLREAQEDGDCVIVLSELR